MDSSRVPLTFHIKQERTKNQFLFIQSHDRSKISPLFHFPMQYDLPEQAPVARKKTVLSSLMLAGTTLVTDVPGMVKGVFTLCDKILGLSDPAVLAALGLTKGFSLVSGGLTIKGGMQEAIAARKISDPSGLVLARLKIAKGTAAVASGVAALPARVLTLVSLVTTVRVVAVVAKILGSVGGALLVVGTLISGIGLTIRLAELRRFRAELSVVLKDCPSGPQRDVATLEHLKRFASVSPQEEGELKKDPQYCALLEAQKAEKLSCMKELLLQQKEAFLVRVTDKKCLQLMRQTHTPETAESSLAAIQQKLREKIGLSLIAASLLAISLVLTLAAFIFTGAASLLILAAASLALSLSWFVFDIYAFLQESKDFQSGKYDALWLRVSNASAVATVGITCLLSHEIAPIAAACAVGTLWLAINQISARYLSQG